MIYIIIPKVYKHSKNIIIMEYIEGEQISNLDVYERSKYIMLSHCCFVIIINLF